jgi:hypothetical protein
MRIIRNLKNLYSNGDIILNVKDLEKLSIYLSVGKIK